MNYQKLVEKVKKRPVPQHVGIIMDGNRRWAKKNLLQIMKGHEKGYQTIKDILEVMREAGVKVLTVFAFSSENFKRAEKEKEVLFDLFAKGFRELKDNKDVHDKKVGINFFGDLKKLPKNVIDAFNAAKESTKNYGNYFINFCMAYSGHDEIVGAVKKIVGTGIKPEEVNADLIKSNLYTKDFPSPDLIIRTGMKNGKRLSGFLLWDSAYSEFIFHETFWPDYTKEMFLNDIIDFQNRNRRFGK
ncbi:MAG: di-trans,poly-cis-decaprenylcistransferase [Nanoarchaeota archaeon]|nr:di-trans,poly-cis-decaprenylcistransferase [Nanoarchaeota archaeon]